MPLLVTEADKLDEDDKARGIIEELIDKDELFALLPFTASANKNYSYVREATISEASFISPYEAVPEGAATFTEVLSVLKALAGDVDIDKFTAVTQSNLNDQVAVQIQAKIKGIGRKFRRTLMNGNAATNSKEFDGLRKLMPATQTIYAGVNGGVVGFDALDELRDMVKLGADVLMMRQGTWRAIRSLLRTFGGNDATHIMIENFGKPVPAYDGTPIIFNDFIENVEVRGTNNNTCSIYALRLNEADGFHGLFAAGAPAGVQYEEIGTIQNMDANRHRVKWYCGTALKATHAVARLAGITNI
ncbi:MAG: major capsid protein [Undibacterium sp.]